MACEASLVKCIDCPATAKARPAKGGGFKTPMRWRKTADGFRCPKCQAAQYMGRSIRLRITGPAEGEDRDRAAMYKALNAASKQSNQFANWYLQQLLAADLAQLAQCRGDKKFPPCPEVDYYRQATLLFPHCAPSSLVQQAQMVKRYYAKERFAALAAMNKNVRSYRWDGLPVVVAAQAWKLLRIDDQRIVLRAQIGPGKSWTLSVFAQGEDLQRMRQIADGEVLPGAAMFVRRARAPRPGEVKRVRVWYLRISAQVPRAQKRRPKGIKEKTLTLGHDAASLLYGTLDDGDDVFEFPAVSLRSLICAHRKLDRQRQIDNSFRHANWSKRKYKRWSVDRTAACERNLNKIKAQLALVAASLTKWCVSHEVTAVDYDTTDRGWIESMPYHALADRIKTSLENVGIACHVLAADGTNTARVCHAEEETEVVA